MLLSIVPKRNALIRHGLKMVSANFGENPLKFVTCENLNVFLIKSNMAAESITMTSQVYMGRPKDLQQYYQTPLVRFNSKHNCSYRPKGMFLNYSAP